MKYLKVKLGLTQMQKQAKRKREQRKLILADDQEKLYSQILFFFANAKNFTRGNAKIAHDTTWSIRQRKHHMA